MRFSWHKRLRGSVAKQCAPLRRAHLSYRQLHVAQGKRHIQAHSHFLACINADFLYLRAAVLHLQLQRGFVIQQRDPRGGGTVRAQYDIAGPVLSNAQRRTWLDRKRGATLAATENAQFVKQGCCHAGAS